MHEAHTTQQQQQQIQLKLFQIQSNETIICISVNLLYLITTAAILNQKRQEDSKHYNVCGWCSKDTWIEIDCEAVVEPRWNGFSKWC